MTDESAGLEVVVGAGGDKFGWGAGGGGDGSGDRGYVWSGGRGTCN